VKLRLASISIAAGVAAAYLLPQAPERWAVTFIDVAERAGLTHRSIYGGTDRKRFII
jgi:hypothetical protein